MSKKTLSATVKVYKYDGSKQCNMGEKKELAAMMKELNGIPVVSMENISDRKLRLKYVAQILEWPMSTKSVVTIGKKPNP